MEIWVCSSNDIKPIRHRNFFWEHYQERLNETLLVVNAGGREPCAAPLGDDKKHGDFTDEDHVRCHEALKFVAHPNLRKDTIGSVAVSPLTSLARAPRWEKAGQTSTDCYKNAIIAMCGSKLNLDRMTFCSDRGVGTLI